MFRTQKRNYCTILSNITDNLKINNNLVAKMDNRKIFALLFKRILLSCDAQLDNFIGIVNKRMEVDLARR